MFNFTCFVCPGQRTYVIENFSQIFLLILNPSTTPLLSVRWRSPTLSITVISSLRLHKHVEKSNLKVRINGVYETMDRFEFDRALDHSILRRVGVEKKRQSIGVQWKEVDSKKKTLKTFRGKTWFQKFDIQWRESP